MFTQNLFKKSMNAKAYDSPIYHEIDQVLSSHATATPLSTTTPPAVLLVLLLLLVLLPLLLLLLLPLLLMALDAAIATLPASAAATPNPSLLADIIIYPNPTPFAIEGFNLIPLSFQNHFLVDHYLPDDEDGNTESLPMGPSV